MAQVEDGHFLCPLCQRKFRWKVEVRGRKVFCSCGAKIRCPLEPSQPMAELVEANPTKPQSKPAPGAPAPAPGKAAAPAATGPADDGGDALAALMAAADGQPPSAASAAPAAGGDGYDLDLPAEPAATGPAGNDGKCPSCNNEVSPGAVLCINCGFNLKEGKPVSIGPPGDGGAAAVLGTAQASAHLKKIRDREAEDAEQRKNYLMTDYFIPAGVALVGLILIIISVFVKAHFIEKAELALAAKYAARGGFGGSGLGGASGTGSGGSVTAGDEADEDEDEDEDEDKPAPRRKSRTGLTSVAPAGASADAGEEKFADEAEFNFKPGEIDPTIGGKQIGDKKGALAEDQEDGSSSSGSTYSTTGGGRGGLAAGKTPSKGFLGLFRAVLWVMVLIRELSKLLLHIPFMFLGMLLVARMFGTSFGNLVPAIIKLLAIVCAEQGAIGAADAVMFALTEGLMGAWMIGTMVSVCVYFPLCFTWFQLDWNEAMVLWVCTFLAPIIIAGFCCMTFIA